MVTLIGILLKINYSSRQIDQALAGMIVPVVILAFLLWMYNPFKRKENDDDDGNSFSWLMNFRYTFSLILLVIMSIYGIVSGVVFFYNY